MTDTNPEDKPVAGDEYNGFTLMAYRIPDDTQDYRVELRRDGQLVREFGYPAYAIYTLLAHWRESSEVNPPEGPSSVMPSPSGSTAGA